MQDIKMPAPYERRPRTNHRFSDNYSYTGKYNNGTAITFTQYNLRYFGTREIPNSYPAFRDLIVPDCVNWFHFTGLSDSITIQRILDEFGMPNLDARDILTPDHVVKIDDLESRFLVVMGSCTYTAKGRLSPEHICFLVHENVVFSFTERKREIATVTIEQIRNNTLNIRDHRSGMLLAFLLNFVLAEMIETALDVEERLEKIERDLLERTEGADNTGSEIQHCRHANLIIRKNSKPLKDEFYLLLKSRPEVIDKQLELVFNELSDQLEYIVQTAENSKEILSSLEDLYVSNNDLKMNDVMKRLTVVSTLFIPITFLVGVWGMNFVIMPETQWKYGYILGWSVILLTALGTWAYMKKKNWF